MYFPSLLHNVARDTFHPHYFLDYLIWLTGWSYFAVWIISSYPQIYLNYKLKSVRGLSFNYLTFNILGHLCYSIYNVCMYYVPAFREAYRQSHQNATQIPVYPNDVAFSVHAFVLTSLTGVQCFFYEHGDQTLHIIAKLIVLVVLSGGSFLLCLVYFHSTSVLNFAYYLSTVKLIITFFKYTPQVYHNYKRQSTEGWSILAVNTDMAGGLLSIVQMVLSAWKDDDWNSLTGNMGKLGLGLLSIMFNAIFIVQHYCLYSNHKLKERYQSSEF